MTSSIGGFAAAAGTVCRHMEYIHGVMRRIFESYLLYRTFRVTPYLFTLSVSCLRVACLENRCLWRFSFKFMISIDRMWIQVGSRKDVGVSLTLLFKHFVPTKILQARWLTSRGWSVGCPLREFVAGMSALYLPYCRADINLHNSGSLTFQFLPYCDLFPLVTCSKSCSSRWGSHRNRSVKDRSTNPLSAVSKNPAGQGAMKKINPRKASTIPREQVAETEACYGLRLER